MPELLLIARGDLAAISQVGERKAKIKERR